MTFVQESSKKNLMLGREQEPPGGGPALYRAQNRLSRAYPAQRRAQRPVRQPLLWGAVQVCCIADL